MEWCYKQKNIVQNKKKVNETLLRTMWIFEKLCAVKDDAHLYIRIHVYKQWCVIRIVAEYMYQRQLIEELMTQYSTIGEEMLFDILREDKNLVIKLAY